jgi:two-component system cell cycle response regulator DivK
MPLAAGVARDAIEFKLVLLVDDDDDTRGLYREYLTRAAMEIDEASDGREALAKAISRRPDVVVTETQLPGINGYELCEVLHRDAVTSDTPVIFVTGDAQVTELHRARQALPDSVLVKPCLPEVLLAEMRRLIRRSRELRRQGAGLRLRLAEQLSRSRDLQARLQATRRKPLSRAFSRHDTTTPPNRPPELLCPNCDKALVYGHSHIGGVSERHSEQWDYYECGSGCGTFQYRQRTRKVRKVI